MTRSIGKYVQVESSGNIWLVTSKRGASLGEVEWYSPWRQWVFIPSDGTEYSQDCLVDIAAFMRSLLKQ